MTCHVDELGAYAVNGPGLDSKKIYIIVENLVLFYGKKTQLLETGTGETDVVLDGR